MTPVSDDILLPAPRGIGGWLQHQFMTHYAPLFRLLRAIPFVVRAPGLYLLTRYDEVREAFLNDAAFGVPYGPNLELIMGHQPFFLGMGDTPEYRTDVAAMRAVVLQGDLPALAAATRAEADRLLDAAGSRIDVVGYTRDVTFNVLAPYFGVTAPANGDLRVWATRLFEFQFTYGGRPGKPDAGALYSDAARFAPLLLAHIDGLIAARRNAPGPDDVLARCLVRQQAGETAYTDAKIRSALTGFVVGGLPQPPMVLPQAVEQLLRRPDRLREAAGLDADGVRPYFMEALRFDPLAPVLQRVVLADATVNAGTLRRQRIPAGAKLFLSFASAMHDERRIAEPARFDPTRPAHEYLHFGYGLHRCFGEQINRALLPVMLERLLRRRVGRVDGAEGHLAKRGIFAERLWVTLG